MIKIEVKDGYCVIDMDGGTKEVSQDIFRALAGLYHAFESNVPMLGRKVFDCIKDAIQSGEIEEMAAEMQRQLQ